ncbi:hypothetical protein FRX31_005350, partial [Thalictrum thalictroides]
MNSKGEGGIVMEVVSPGSVMEKFTVEIAKLVRDLGDSSNLAKPRLELLRLAVKLLSTLGILNELTVNRGLMGTIESLQLKAEEEIDEDVTNQEFAGTDEQSETVNIDNGKAEKQDDSKVVQNPPENKSKNVYKKRKTNNEPLLSNPDGVGKDDKSMDLSV